MKGRTNIIWLALLHFKSIFSVGATSTLVFGLASKDIATQLISGLTLHLSDKMFEGDDVRFHDGTSGKIQNMGWFETMIRNSGMSKSKMKPWTNAQIITMM